MKDPHDVLHQKESEMYWLKTQIQALHSVIPLLADETDFEEFGLATPCFMRVAPTSRVG